jgi:hypothetical protein
MKLFNRRRKGSKTIQWREGAQTQRAECLTFEGSIASARLLGDPGARWAGAKPRSHKRRLAVVLGGLLPLLMLGVGAGVLNGQTVAVGIPAYDHIFFVVDENHARSQVMGKAPYLTSLASANAQSAKYFAVTHPSVNNYLALFSGQTYRGITDGCIVGSGLCHTSAVNLTDEILASGRTAKGYMESMPTPCYPLHDAGPYTERHNPFPYFDQIRTDPARCASVVPYPEFAADLGTVSTTPNYAWITPNLQNDMHDGSVAQGDAWAQANFPAIFNSPAWKTQRSLLIFTVDEDDGSAGNNVPFFVVSSDGSTRTNYTSTIHANHYSALRTIEAAWGLGQMTGRDASAAPMSDLFVGGPSPSPGDSPTPSPSPVGSPTPSPSPVSSSTPSPSPVGSPTPSPPPPGQPIRAAFVYPWYPETWSQGSHFMPFTAQYDSANAALLRMQVASMLYANITTGITSWFGPGTREDSRIPAQLAADRGTAFNTALYYEREGYVDPSAVQIAADMDYAARYFTDPSYLHIHGQPVVFVYGDGADGCDMVQRWAQGTAGKGIYLVLKVFGGYLSCASQPSSWHQYSGAAREDKQGKFSTTISPGFWKSGEPAPRLARDPVAFAAAVRDMVSRGAQWQLIVSFNELVEGTQIEPTTQSFTPCSGWSVELNILHRDGQPGPC